MRFFGIKHRDKEQRRRNNESSQKTPPLSAGSETRSHTSHSREAGHTDFKCTVRSGSAVAQAESRHQLPLHPAQTEEIGFSRTKSPVTRCQEFDLYVPPSTRSDSAPERQRTLRANYSNSRSQSAVPENSTPLQAPLNSEQLYDRSDEKVQYPNQNASSPGRMPGNPASILHKAKYPSSNGNYHSPERAMVPPASNCSPVSSSPIHPSNRVRFMSCSSSIVSTDTSEVHLMAGGGSLASSNMSSSFGFGDVFDNALNMVMAEEEERLNAMGMSTYPPKIPKSGHSMIYKDDRNNEGKGTFRNSALIDSDTGLEVGVGHNAPLELDKGPDIDIEYTEDEYHDVNDDQIDEVRWNLLNKLSSSGKVETGEDHRGMWRSNGKRFVTDEKSHATLKNVLREKKMYEQVKESENFESLAQGDLKVSGHDQDSSDQSSLKQKSEFWHSNLLPSDWDSSETFFCQRNKPSAQVISPTEVYVEGRKPQKKRREDTAGIAKTSQSRWVGNDFEGQLPRVNANGLATF